MTLSNEMVSKGITPPSTIIFDGEIHRYGKNKPFWYVAFEHPIPVCLYGDWKQGLSCKYIHKTGKQQSFEEQHKVKKH